MGLNELIISWDWLGRTSYEECCAFQEKTREEVLKEELPGALLLTEHEKVFTFGRRESGENLLFSPELLKKKGFSIVKTTRGGLVTYHGPGQLVIYPILDLKKMRLKVKEYVAKLELSVIHLLANYGIKAIQRSGFPGVWLSDKKKIGSLGIHVKRMVTMHGFALNVTTDLDDFNYINPCGFKQIELTSMAKEGVKIDDLSILADGYASSFEETFGARIKKVNLSGLDNRIRVQGL